MAGSDGRLPLISHGHTLRHPFIHGNNAVSLCLTTDIAWQSRSPSVSAMPKHGKQLGMALDSIGALALRSASA